VAVLKIKILNGAIDVGNKRSYTIAVLCLQNERRKDYISLEVKDNIDSRPSVLFISNYYHKI